MYTQNKDKILIICAAISGSLIHEIDCGDITDLKAFRKELNDLDSFKAYDQVFSTDYHKVFLKLDTIEIVRSYLKVFNTDVNYKCIKSVLSDHGVSCCGFTDSGRSITIYNSVAQLTIDCSKPTGPQTDQWISKWMD